MQNYSFALPDIGEGIAQAEIVAWHAQPGDMLDEDAPLVDVMTDKATIEITAPVSGQLLEVGAPVGQMLAIGAMLARFGLAGEALAPAAAAPPAPAPQAAPLQAAPLQADAPAPSAAPQPAPAPAPEPAPEPAPAPAPAAAAPSARVLASPAVRARARDLGIDLARVRSADGRIRHADLDAFLLYNREAGYTAPAASRPDEAVPVVGLRRRIAENMAAAKRHIPHFTYVEEIDMSALEALRADLNANRGEGPRLTMLPLLIAAVCRVIPRFPMLNARYDDEANVVTRLGAVHMGLATQTDAGLMVPVIREAQARNIWQLAAEIARLAEAARTGRAAREELTGSSLTISSLGPLGGIVATPVINRPEVAILAPGRIVARPVVREGQIAIAQMMNLSISCDHRVVDGHDAASFVAALRQMLETPALIFAPAG